MHRTKTAILGIFGTGASYGSVAAVGFEGNLETWLKIITLALGSLSALVTIIWMHRLNKVKLQNEEARLCHYCMQGFPPPVCPIYPAERPQNCPSHTKKPGNVRPIADINHQI